jgi:predicted helicase
MPFGMGDYGIDIVCEKEGEYIAVQCKFKNPKSPVRVMNKKGEIKTIYPCVGWKELTTFNELCNSTGPWSERIVMTTAKSVRRLGGIKREGDKSICLGSFRKLKREDFEKMMEKEEKEDIKEEKEDNTEENKEDTKKISIEELRKRRLEFYNKTSI